MAKYAFNEYHCENSSFQPRDVTDYFSGLIDEISISTDFSVQAVLICRNYQ